MNYYTLSWKFDFPGAVIFNQYVAVSSSAWLAIRTFNVKG